MAEPDQTQPPTDTEPTPPETTGGEQKAFDLEYVKKLRAEAADYRMKAKAGEDAVKKLAEIEEAGKTEAQKTAEQLAKLQAENTNLQQKILRQTIAAKHGVPEKRLVGTTEEELEADAAELAAELKAKADAGKPGPPKADNMGEKTPIDQSGQVSVDAVKSMKPADVLKALKEGRLNDVLKAT